MLEQAGRHNKRVIIVDHDEATTQLIAELLAGEGYDPLSCSAWLLSVAFIEQVQANLMILDLSLTNPSAVLDLISELRRNASTRTLPVIVNSTDQRQLEQLAVPLYDLGCVVLAKPFELDDFFSTIYVCLNPDSRRTQYPAC
jgi:DNA-binding response OmpR family regulator